MPSVGDVLRLVRAPNTFTAAADVVAGAAVGHMASASAPPALTIAAVAGGSMLVYGGGIALNDVVDRERDAEIHPERVIPSGAVSVAAAIRVAVSCAVVALALFAVGGLDTIRLGLAVMGAVLLYDLVMKSRGILACASMGVCRSLNLALGLAVTGGADAATTHWMLPAGYGFLVFAVTAVSLFEDRSPGAMKTPVLLCLAAAYATSALPGEHTPWVLAGAFMLAGWVIRPGLAPSPRWGLIVRNAVFTLPFFNALACVAADAMESAVICAAIFFVVRGLALAIAQKGS